MNIHPKRRLTVLIASRAEHLKAVGDNTEYIKILAGVDTITLGESIAQPEASATAVCGPFTVFVPLAGVIDFDEEKRRLTGEIDKVDQELSKVNKKLSNEDFIKKAPKDVVKKEKERMATLVSKRDRVKESLDRLGGLLKNGK
jgi:valyl-tRNA synthetase